ncbi:MAG: SDR family oxidoreductase [Bryobacterales bacterium]|nr:SDR family oxidoreductase [Bryobacterales bacterium]
MRLRNKRVLVTGAASGIGLACADRCEAEGAVVIRVDRGEFDVTDEAAVNRFFASVAAPLDVLINSAGIAVRRPVHRQDTAGWDAVFAVNVRGSFLCSRAAIPLMEDNGGSIVHMASVVGLAGVRNRAAYSSSAIVALTRNMAMDYAQFRIRVNCLCPGFTRTPLTSGLFADPERLAKLTALHPLGRLGEPEDVAAAALFLASDEAAWITGQAIAVDGGFTAGHAVDV